MASTEPIVNRDRSNGNLRPWKPGQSGNIKGRPKQDPRVREILEARLPEMAHKLVSLALNEPGDVPYGVQERALQAGFDRCWGKPEQQRTVSGRVDFAHLLAEYTEQRKLIEGECEVVEDSEAGANPSGNGAAEGLDGGESETIEGKS